MSLRIVSVDGKPLTRRTLILRSILQFLFLTGHFLVLCRARSDNRSLADVWLGTIVVMSVPA